MKDKLKLWHFSDTHTYHELLKIPENIDLVIFSGDCSNPKDNVKNYIETINFITWFSKLDIKYKIFIAGNHDISIEKNFLNILMELKKNNIIYLENSIIEIEGIKIFGSPFTPTFGDWSFMKSRDKMYDIWKNIPENINIIVSHGPPKGILDLSYSRDNILEYCGCKTLKTKILQIQPEYCLFGHIHNCEDIINAGYIKLSNYKTIFSNGSVVTDGKFGKLTSNGNIFEINIKR